MLGVRAIADASRFALHDVLRRSGPATVSKLASRLDAEPHTIVEDLKALEEVQLVERVGEDERWAVIGKGFVFEIPEDAEGQRAARRVTRVMLLQYLDLPAVGVRRRAPSLAGMGARRRAAARAAGGDARRYGLRHAGWAGR